MSVSWWAIVGAALAGSPAGDPPLVLPQPWKVDARRDKPFTWVTPGDTRQDWIASRVTTDFRAGPQTAERRRLDVELGIDRSEPVERVAVASFVDLAVHEGGTRWDLTLLTTSVRVGAGKPDPDLRIMSGVSSIGWSVAEDEQVQIDGYGAGSYGAWSLWEVVEEPFAHLPISPPKTAVMPGDTWKEPKWSALVRDPHNQSLTKAGLTAAGRFDGWVKHEGHWLALLRFELDLTLGVPLEAELVSTSYLLIDPVDGFPVWAACLNEWTNAGREPWSERVVRERDE